MSAYLLLEDGTRLDGLACGHDGAVTGEVVFNTAMTGYQESVTDPSYAGQIIVFTYPLIGNYGVSATAMESDRIHARGVVMRDAKNGEDVATAEGAFAPARGRRPLAIPARAVLEQQVGDAHVTAPRAKVRSR